MPWVILILSGVFEAVWATALGRSEGLTKVGPTVVYGMATGAEAVSLAKVLLIMGLIGCIVGLKLVGD